MRARVVLDGIKAQLAAATPGPWGCVQDMYRAVPMHRIGSQVSGSDVAHLIMHAGQDKANASFIAAAPGNIERLTNALEAVLAVHEPVDAVMNPGRHERIVKVCTGCGTDDGNWQRFPCPTVAAVEAALTKDEP